jgi:hypothetical protein
MNSSAKYGFLTLICLGFLSCLSCAADAPNKNQQICGLWRNKYEDADLVILRRPDGTFAQKEVRIYNVAKPPVRISCEGKWQLKGNYYILEYTKTSPVPWTRTIGKVIKFEVLKISPPEFSYLARDGGLVTEQKIGNASESGFNEATISLK